MGCMSVDVRHGGDGVRYVWRLMFGLDMIKRWMVRVQVRRMENTVEVGVVRMESGWLVVVVVVVYISVDVLPPIEQ